MDPTPEQQAIINSQRNRVVIAKPGSGKTFTLSYIIKNLLPMLPTYKGVIAISYTNKASKELQDRCLGSGLDKKSSFFGTIDKFCIAEIIMPYLPHLWGMTSTRPSISNFKDAEIGEMLGEDKTKEIRGFLESGQEDMPTNIIAHVQYLYGQGHILLQLVPKIALYVLTQCPSAMRYLKARYSHIIVDEYQDTGLEQHKIFSILSTNGIIGIAVGDLEQSIFGFAGKSPEYLAQLATNANYEVFSLNRNHRCHASIVNYSLRLMSQTANLLETDGIHIFYRNVPGDEEEIGAWISKAIPKAKQKYGFEDNNKCAILIRGRRTGQLVAQGLTIPYKFFQDTELDNDSALWSEIFRGILNIVMDPQGNVVDLVTEYFGNFDSEHKALYQNLSRLKEYAKNPISLIAQINVFFEVARFINPAAENEKAKALLEATLSNSQILTNYIPAQSHELQIMTLHKSKGLEFDIVFHLDLYNWILPGYDAINGDKGAWTQDINLHYVGITRAKKCCLLLSSDRRHKADNTITTGTPSKFLFVNSLNALRQ